MGFAIVPDDQERRAGSVREQLQDAAELDLGDYLQFRIGAAQVDLAAPPLGGARFPCEAILAGKSYAKFHIDVGFGDAVVGGPEILIGEGLLEFAGIGPPRVAAIACAQQFAEKIHAYSFPWTDRTNTRVKDLVDLVLVIETRPPEPIQLCTAAQVVFATRKKHALSKYLSPPPALWQADFAAMAAEVQLSTDDYLAGFAILQRFWDSLPWAAQGR